MALTNWVQVMTGCDSVRGIFQQYSPPEVDRIWGIWGPYYHIPKVISYLLTGDFNVNEEAADLAEASKETLATRELHLLGLVSWISLQGFPFI